MHKTKINRQCGCFCWFAVHFAIILHGVRAADALDIVQNAVWNDPASKLYSLLEVDLEGRTGKNRDQRFVAYWENFGLPGGNMTVSNLEKEFERITAETIGRGVDGSYISSGYFVRLGRSEQEARIESLRAWILRKSPEMLADFIGQRMTKQVVSKDDLITVDAINQALVDSATNLHPLEYWVGLYRDSKNPSFRLIACAKCIVAAPACLSGISSESNEWGFASHVIRKRVFEEFAKDSNHFIKDFSAENLVVYSDSVKRMESQYNYSEADVPNILVRRVSTRLVLSNSKSDHNVIGEEQPELGSPNKPTIREHETKVRENWSWQRFLSAFLVIAIIHSVLRALFRRRSRNARKSTNEIK